jgi:hypothetical protein
MKVTLKMRLGAKAVTMETISATGTVCYYPAIMFPGTRGKKFFLVEGDGQTPAPHTTEESAQNAADKIVSEEVEKAKRESAKCS